MHLGRWCHISVDMQRMFAEDTPWHIPWMAKALPSVALLCEAAPERTVFTRFIPPAKPQAATGGWRDYYERWWMMTGEHLPPDMLDLVPELAVLVPPARVLDKPVYSPWIGTVLHANLTRDAIETLIVTGGETDVCVLATVLGAIDLGYRVLLVNDAVCSGVDMTHDASLALLGKRYSTHVSSLPAQDVLDLIREQS